MSSVVARTLYVAALNPNRKFGSLEEQILAFARLFRERGSYFIPVFEVAPDGELGALFANENLPAFGLNLWRFRWGTLRQLLKLVDMYAVQVAHWNFYDPLSPYFAALVLLRPSIRHVFTHHSSRPWPSVPPRSRWVRWLKAAVLRRYAMVLGVSDFVVRCLRAEGWWGPVGRYWHFVNLNRFVPDLGAGMELRRELGARECLLLVVVGQLIPEKGIHVLIQALTKLPDDVSLWVIGEGPDLDHLTHLAASSGTRVRFLGNQSHVERYLQAADIGVCPSIWAEAAGLVNLEVEATGVPLVATAVGGIPELVVNGETGILVPAGNPDALAAAILELKENPARRREMGLAGRRFAEANFCSAETLERNLAVYTLEA